MDQTVLRLDSLIDVWQKQDFFSIVKHARSALYDITLTYQEKFQRSLVLFHQLFCNNTAHLKLQDINVMTKYFFPFFASRRKISIRDTIKQFCSRKSTGVFRTQPKNLRCSLFAKIAASSRKRFGQKNSIMDIRLG